MVRTTTLREPVSLGVEFTVSVTFWPAVFTNSSYGFCGMRSG